MQYYISHRRGRVCNSLIIFFSFLSLSCFIDLLQKILEVDVFFNFCFTEKMIFPSNAENHENMIFTLSVFTKILLEHLKKKNGFSCSACFIFTSNVIASYIYAKY